MRSVKNTQDQQKEFVVLRERKGSAAMLVIPLFLALFIFVGVAVNFGQVARVRIETATAADFSCLAAASWAGSGATECALITNNINSVITMMQALFLVPFCPDTETYAEQLRDSFTLDTAPFGPIAYYQKVCKGVMEEGRKQGGAYFAAACYNNFLTGTGDSMDFGQLQAIRENPSGANFNFDWSVSRPGVTYSHEASCELTNYPDEFYAELESEPLTLNYYIWEDQPLSFTHYNCDPRGLGYNAPGELAEMEAEDLENPLKVIDDGGPRKVYEANLSEPVGSGRVPQPGDMNFGGCTVPVCGIREESTEIADVIPDKITPEEGISVGTMATHKVDSSSAMSAIYTPFYPEVEHGATCEAKPYPQPGDFPTDKMKIKLTGTT